MNVKEIISCGRTHAVWQWPRWLDSAPVSSGKCVPLKCPRSQRERLIVLSAGQVLRPHFHLGGTPVRLDFSDSSYHLRASFRRAALAGQKDWLPPHIDNPSLESLPLQKGPNHLQPSTALKWSALRWKLVFSEGLLCEFFITQFLC